MADVPMKTETFGGCNVAGIGPSGVEAAPATINLTISFEEALKLHLSIGQALAKLNAYNRAQSPGKSSAMVLRVYPKKPTPRVAVYEGQIPKQPKERSKNAEVPADG